MSRSITGFLSDPPRLTCFFRISGIRVQIHATFFLLLLLQLWNNIHITREYDPLLTLYTLVLYGPILFVTILCHELGHAFACRRLGGECQEIVLWPLGGFAVCGPPNDVAGDLKVAAAGPITHLPQAAFWAAVYGCFNGFDFEHFQSRIISGSFGSFCSVVSAQAFDLNLAVMCFNLFVPAYPLDGGRCMAATLILLGSSVQDAGKVTSISAMVISFLLGILAILRLIKSDLGGLFYGAVAFYMFQESYNLYRLVKEGRTREHPLFSRDCYDERERSDNTTGSTNANSSDDKDEIAEKDEFELAGGEAA